MWEKLKKTNHVKRTQLKKNSPKTQKFIKISKYFIISKKIYIFVNQIIMGAEYYFASIDLLCNQQTINNLNTANIKT